MMNDLPALVWAANLADLELHTFLHRAPAIERPTALAFDLDPGPPADIVLCCHVGVWLQAALERLGLESFAKTSGSKGLQLFVPLNITPWQKFVIPANANNRMNIALATDCGRITACLWAIRTKMGESLVIVTKRDPFLCSRVTDSKNVEAVIVITRPLGNIRRIPAKSGNETFYHPIQFIVLPGDEDDCLVVLLFRKLMLEPGNIFIPKIRANRQAQPDCCRLNRGEWPDVIKLA
jgi:hypothetical protein